MPQDKQIDDNQYAKKCNLKINNRSRMEEPVVIIRSGQINRSPDRLL